MIRPLTKRLINPTTIRFAIIGLFNTALDFLLFNILLHLFSGDFTSHREIIIFNSISASTIAMISFLLNRRYVFKSQKTPHHYVIYFILITLVGLYIIQNLIIYAVTKQLSNSSEQITSFLNNNGIWSLNTTIVIANLGKIVGSSGSMLWNYKMYKYVVFHHAAPSKKKK